MPNQAVGFAGILAGGVLLTAAITGDGLTAVVTGKSSGPTGFGGDGTTDAGPADASGPASGSPSQSDSGVLGSVLGKIIGTPHTGTHTLGNWQSDNAYDIAAPLGTTFYSVVKGTVIKVTPHPQDNGRFAGDAITIKADSGNELFYKHGTASVHVGQKVDVGTPLGRTGEANGVAHLHFASMDDPAQFLKDLFRG